MDNLAEMYKTIPNKFIQDDVVTATVYSAVKEQTNVTFNITASGFVIRNTVNILAVSRDLLDKYPYGTVVQIKHPVINRKYGHYFVVLDTMNKRMSKTIDILVDKNDPPDIWHNVMIKKLNSVQ